MAGVQCGIFAIFDANQDGEVTKEELDDTIDTWERCQMSKPGGRGARVSQSDRDVINSEFDKADENGNGVVTTEEFFKYLQGGNNPRGLVQILAHATNGVTFDCDANSQEITDIFNRVGGDLEKNCITVGNLTGAYYEQFAAQ